MIKSKSLSLLIPKLDRGSVCAAWVMDPFHLELNRFYYNRKFTLIHLTNQKQTQSSLYDSKLLDRSLYSFAFFCLSTSSTSYKLCCFIVRQGHKYRLLQCSIRCLLGCIRRTQKSCWHDKKQVWYLGRTGLETDVQVAL